MAVPLAEKLDFVIKFTARELAPHLEQCLNLWEAASAAILAREHHLKACLRPATSLDHSEQWSPERDMPIPPGYRDDTSQC